MSAESPRHARSGGPLTVPPQPPADRSIIDAVSGFINDVTLSSASNPDPKDTIQWARFETADINEAVSEGSSSEVSPLLLVLGYGAGVQVWLIPPNGEAQEVLSWRQGSVRVLRILPTPTFGDSFASKRPLIALCDSASPGPAFCSLSFISIRGGEQVKSIKFKNPILDVLANKRSVVVSFSERFAVFDAGTLEDRMAVTTCYPCPCPLGGNAPINPLALGDRWLAYADKKINPSKRSSGGCEGEGVTSYTATVLHAAKSLSAGLRGLGESVAQSLGGGRGASPPTQDHNQPGVLTVCDIEGNNEDDTQDGEEPYDPIVAHFVAHSEAIIAISMDASGLLLVTADRRGHDFHVFRINPHPCGPSLASVHHLYILHRGDTTAKVQDIAISPDSRWCAISTLRGTTHIFPISPYGGTCGVRTHTQPRVVNRLSRFHRSAGLPIQAHTAPARSGSPVGDGMSQGAWFPNPRLPPFPLPTTVTPLAQLRPTANIPTHTITRNSSGRQRLSSLSEDSLLAPLLARARFGTLVTSGSGAGATRGGAHLALYLMAANGCLLHLMLTVRPSRNVPKEKICDESPIELEVEPISQWPLQRPPAAADLLAPLPASNPLLQPMSCRRCADACVSEEERWLAQVEIVTHAGPHRRLWMGPQFVFKTYTSTGSNSSLSEAETVEVETSVASGVARSNPVNMPGVRPIVPVLIDSGSASSVEHSPVDSLRRKSLLEGPRVTDVQLREDLAEAMKEDHGWRAAERSEAERGGQVSVAITRAVDPLGTVVVPTPGCDPVLDDPDLYTHSNDDEAHFRPVVRAPAVLPSHADIVVRPLPRGTRIPVQTLTPVNHLSPDDEPLPLASHVVIPVALTDADPVRDHCALPTDYAEVDKVDDDVIHKDLKEAASETHERKSAETADGETLPKSHQSDDIQPAARVKKSPTPKLLSDRENSDSSVNTKRMVLEEEVKRIEVTVGIKQTKVDDKDGAKQTKPFEMQDDRIKPLKKQKDDKQMRLNDKDDSESTNPFKVAKPIDDDAPTKCPKVVKTVDEDDPKTTKPLKEVKPKEDNCPKRLKETKLNDDNYSKTVISSEEVKKAAEIEKSKVKPAKLSKEIKSPKEEVIEPVKEIKNDPSVTVTTKLPLKSKEFDKTKRCEEDIKTEEQAWDLLLNETEKNEPITVQPTASVEKGSEETKTKPKRNRKNRKTQEDAATKAEEDSFVEIHAIDDKSQVSSGDLVAISSPYDDSEATRQYYNKRKTRSPKSITPERKVECEYKEDKYEKSFDIVPLERTISPIRKSKIFKTDDNIEVLFNSKPYQDKEFLKDAFETIQVRKDGTASESTSFFEREISLPKTKKSKSLSPYLDSNRKMAEKSHTEIDHKDLIIIDSTKDEFPEITITRGNKNRIKTPQPVQKIDDPEPVIEKPVKSWSSIAASKNAKKAPEVMEKKGDECKFDILDEATSSKEVSLQDKLFELCKRTDIMVAECDTPTELNFVEEHMLDLPPLEALDFALDDFKLEVMRDSLLEVNDAKIVSPICKINIDDILSSIKETTNRVIESSTFNLVDLEKVPITREKGFSVIENDKITTQEIDIKIDKREEKESEIMEKSSDDDNASPVLSTDSDKEDKRAVSLSSLVQPSAKQSAKSKKSRRKKK